MSIFKSKDDQSGWMMRGQPDEPDEDALARALSLANPAVARIQAERLAMQGLHPKRKKPVVETRGTVLPVGLPTETPSHTAKLPINKTQSSSARKTVAKTAPASRKAPSLIPALKEPIRQSSTKKPS